ncbi:MAG TPA: hypothetical protein VHY55_08405 [Acidimicrobiia bacterium]|nr:hypothetical protein [Acidimicrobiia bacterium]
MSGFLHGISASTPPDALVSPLHPALWRGTPSTVPYARARDFGARYMLIVSSEWGYPATGWGRDGSPYEHPEKWKRFVHEVAQAWSGQPAIFDVWNEPDGSDFWNGTQAQLFDVWTSASRAIAEDLGTGVEIVGPSLSRYDPTYIAKFLDACSAAPGCRVTGLSWHEFVAPSAPISGITDHLRDARRRFLDNPKYQALGLDKIYITESVAQASEYRPGDIIGYLSALEQGGAAGTTRACWADQRGRSQCFNDTLDGLLTPGIPRPRSAWWTYERYADGVASRVGATSDDASVAVIASRQDDGGGLPQIMIGRHGGEGSASKTASVSTVIRGIESIPSLAGASALEASVERLPDRGTAPVDAPEQLGTVRAAVRDGEAIVTLPAVALHDAYVLRLTPG